MEEQEFYEKEFVDTGWEDDEFLEIPFHCNQCGANHSECCKCNEDDGEE